MIILMVILLIWSGCKMLCLHGICMSYLINNLLTLDVPIQLFIRHQ